MKLTLDNILRRGREVSQIKQLDKIDFPFFIYSTLISNYGYISLKEFNEMPLPIMMGLYSNSIKQYHEMKKDMEKSDLKSERLMKK